MRGADAAPDQREARGARESPAAVTSRQIKGKGLAFPTGTEGMKDMVLST